MTLLRLAGRYLAPHRFLVAMLLLLEVISVISILALPMINADLIDNGLARADLDHIVRAGAIMLAVTLGQAGAAVLSTYLGSRVAADFGRDLRREVFGHTGRLATKDVREFTVPSLINRCTNDVQQIQTLVLMTCTVILMAPILLVGGIVMAVRIDVGLSWLMLVAVPLVAMITGILVVRMIPTSRMIQERLDTVNRILREQLIGARVTRAFLREPQESQRFAQGNRDLTIVSRRVGRVMASFGPIVVIVMYLTIAGVLWFGGQRVDTGQMQLGAVAAYITYVMQIVAATSMVTVLLAMVPRASVCANRIRAVLDTAPKDVASPTATATGPIDGFIDMADVEFRRSGTAEPVLHGINLSVRPGELVGVIGATGSGKSTLLALISRLLDVSVGRVSIDGHDVRDLDPEVLTRSVGLVPQNSYLFSGTIASNLRFGRPDATEAQLWEALRVAEVADMVESLEGGLSAPVHQGGSNFSGGQRQRLCIARTLVSRPQIYLLDDPFSALDLGTAARLRRGLRDVLADSTVLMVAQRVSAVADADRIVVVNGGRIVGSGRHQDLLQDCPTYRDIAASQQALEVRA